MSKISDLYEEIRILNDLDVIDEDVIDEEEDSIGLTDQTIKLKFINEMRRYDTKKMQEK